MLGKIQLERWVGAQQATVFRGYSAGSGESLKPPSLCAQGREPALGSHTCLLTGVHPTVARAWFGLGRDRGRGLLRRLCSVCSWARRASVRKVHPERVGGRRSNTRSPSSWLAGWRPNLCTEPTSLLCRSLQQDPEDWLRVTWSRPVWDSPIGCKSLAYQNPNCRLHLSMSYHRNVFWCWEAFKM